MVTKGNWGKSRGSGVRLYQYNHWFGYTMVVNFFTWNFTGATYRAILIIT